MIDLLRLHEKSYRMDNLYKIVDRDGNSIPFVMNDVQRDVSKNLHNRNIILKARQLGMSTYAVLYILDETLFNYNLSAGIVSYSLQHAQHIFKRIIGHALENLPKSINPGILTRSAHEITFNNGSHLRVDTTLRGGTCQLLLVSEFGKTCARSPIKAEEIVTGTLQTVAPDGRIIIESTGEGNEGYFAEMVTAAETSGNENLSKLDYKLFFYPWYKEKSYQLEQKVNLDTELIDYFKEIEKTVNLTEQQKNWYATQCKVYGDKIQQEYPSTIQEAFLSNSDAYYFAEGVQKAYKESRVLNVNPYDAMFPVYVSMDIGVNDLTVLLFFQCVHGEIRFIDCYKDNNKSLDFYVNHLLQEKNYLYDTIFLPHDATQRSKVAIEETYEYKFKELVSHTDIKVRVLNKIKKGMQIMNAKVKLDRAVFYSAKTKDLIDHLSKYRKRWHEPTGRYLDEPLHDIHSNAADAFQYAMEAVSIIEKSSCLKGAKEKHRQAVENRRHRLI